jgi:hypothetical protein
MEVTAIIFKFAVGTVGYIMSSRVNILIKKSRSKERYGTKQSSLCFNLFSIFIKVNGLKDFFKF